MVVRHQIAALHRGMLDALDMPHRADVAGGAVGPSELDPKGSRETGSKMVLDEDTKRPISTIRRFSKGLAMEVVTASLLTFVDHPRQVRAYWTVMGPRWRQRGHQ